MWLSLATVIVGGLLAIVTLVCITVLLVNDVSVPAEFYGLLGTAAAGAGFGAAFAQGASIASK